MFVSNDLDFLQVKFNHGMVISNYFSPEEIKAPLQKVMVNSVLETPPLCLTDKLRTVKSEVELKSLKTMKVFFQ